MGSGEGGEALQFSLGSWSCAAAWWSGVGLVEE